MEARAWWGLGVAVVGLGIVGAASRTPDGTFTQAVLLQFGSALLLAPLLFIFERRLEKVVRVEVEDQVAANFGEAAVLSDSSTELLDLTAAESLFTQGFEQVDAGIAQPGRGRVTLYANSEGEDQLGAVFIGTPIISRSFVQALFRGSAEKLAWIVTSQPITRAALDELEYPQVMRWNTSEAFPKVPISSP